MLKNLKTTSEQHARFIDTARAVGCDDDEATFKAKLAVIAKQKPKDEPQSAKAPKRRQK